MNCAPKAVLECFARTFRNDGWSFAIGRALSLLQRYIGKRSPVLLTFSPTELILLACLFPYGALSADALHPQVMRLRIPFFVPDGVQLPSAELILFIAAPRRALSCWSSSHRSQTHSVA